PLDDWRLPPVPFVGLEHELDAGVEAHKPVGTGADRRLLEAVVADLLHVLLGHDPARARRRGAVERHKVGPRLLEKKAHARGVDDLTLAPSLLEEWGTAAPVAVERELPALGRDRLAVVELGSLTEHELVLEPILRLGPRLSQARGVDPRRHGLH